MDGRTLLATMTRIKAAITAMATITAKATSLAAPCRVMDWTELRPWHLDILSQSQLTLQCSTQWHSTLCTLHILQSSVVLSYSDFLEQIANVTVKHLFSNTIKRSALQFSSIQCTTAVTALNCSAVQCSAVAQCSSVEVVVEQRSKS